MATARTAAVDTANCTGGTRTCFQRAVCIYCRSEYGDLYPHQLKTFKRPATCRQEGLEYTRCTAEGCSYRTPDIITPKQHNLKKAREFTRKPTCTKPGWNSYYLCQTCTYSETDWIEKLGHDWEQHEAKAPTCTEIGWDAYDTCSRCNHTTRTELPALNHDLEQHEAKAPTCTEIGWDAYDTCSRCDYTTYVELPALNHDYQAVTVDPTCEADGYTVFTCSRCKDSYTADPTDKLGHKFGAWSLSGSLSAEDVTARTNGEYLSVAFETAGSLTQPTGRIRLALPAGLLEGKKLVRIAPDGTQTELPFEAKNGRFIFTLDFANSELPVMLFRLVPQTTVL